MHNNIATWSSAEWIAGKKDALNGKSMFLQTDSAREIIKPVEGFPWTGLGIFLNGEDILVSKGWGENGQCMMKLYLGSGEISVAMTNKNPGTPQEESGIEWLVDSYSLHSVVLKNGG